jgi:beta-glucosidase
MYVHGDPLFAFGHGLSYTTFQYRNLKLSSASMKADGQVSVSADLTNTGQRAGDEVMQLYVHQQQSAVKLPDKELRGFARLTMQPGETKTVTFPLPAAKLAHWDETTHGFMVDPGAFDVMIGAASDDLRLKGLVTVGR